MLQTVPPDLLILTFFFFLDILFKLVLTPSERVKINTPDNSQSASSFSPFQMIRLIGDGVAPDPRTARSQVGRSGMTCPYEKRSLKPVGCLFMGIGMKKYINWGSKWQDLPG